MRRTFTMQLLNRQNAVFLFTIHIEHIVLVKTFSSGRFWTTPPEVFPKSSGFQKVPSDLPFGNPALWKPLRALRSENLFLKALSVLQIEIIHPSEKQYF